MLTENDTNREVGDDYGLQRTYLSSIRLNAQHYLWKDTVGCNLHPSIPVPNQPSTRIADVGTGTSIWVDDVKRQYPSVQVDGFDISLDQSPAQGWMPQGTTVSQLDITKPLPSSLVEQYDIVHLRLFLVVVKNNDPVPVLKNLIKMLKPGGWLQWGEQNLYEMSCESVDPEPADCAMRKFLDIIQGHGVGLWVPDLAKTMATEGLLNTRMYKYPVAPHARLYWTQMQFNSTGDFTMVAMDNSTPESDGPQTRNVINRAVIESRQGIALGFVPCVAIGKKP